MTDKIRIFITCAGSGVAQSVVDSLKHLKDHYFILTSDQTRYRFSVPDCDAFIKLPKISDSNYLSSVQKVCEEWNIDVLIPGHDHELELFARASDNFLSLGTQVAVSGYDFVRLLRNKLAWAKEFRKKTDTVVKSMSAAEFWCAPDAMRYPLIAKPLGGSASTGLHILYSKEEAHDLSDNVVIQEFLFPCRTDPDFEDINNALKLGQVLQVSEVSVQLLYSARGELLGRFASQNKLKHGVPVEVRPLDSPAVWRAVAEIEDIIHDLEPKGPVNIQGRLTDEGLKFFEMNPRFTGITGNRAQFGFNEVDAICRNLARGQHVVLQSNHSKIGVRQVACRTWSTGAFLFDDAARAIRTIILLGGTSWLGRAIVQRCRDHGHKVVIICRAQSFENASKLYTGYDNVTIISDADPAIYNYLSSTDAVVNLASARPPSGEQAIRQSHGFQVEWLNRAVVAQVPVVLNVSSQSVYDPDAGPWTENSALCSMSAYALSKVAIEMHLESLRIMAPEMTTVSLRIGRLFGPVPGYRVAEFPHKCVKEAISGGRVGVTSPSNIMDLLDVRDAASAVLHFLSIAPRQANSVYNIGSGKPIAVGDLIALIQERTRIKGLPGIEPSFATQPPDQLPRSNFLDSSKANTVGWYPAFTHAETIDALIDDISSR